MNDRDAADTIIGMCARCGVATTDDDPAADCCMACDCDDREALDELEREFSTV